MTTVERLQAAIGKLERLKVESTPGLIPDGVSRTENPVDVELLSTLHRAIDLQIALLRFGIKRQEAIDWTARHAGDLLHRAASLELALADAILGEES